MIHYFILRMVIRSIKSDEKHVNNYIQLIINHVLQSITYERNALIKP
ncbi:hypothetical protein SAMN05192588_1791 [Nonlabens sp. Hel1_33_55]|nr:hypothetical protein SAMN05192588_1791 [Nonlabens sp. Hel1_33_55]